MKYDYTIKMLTFLFFLAFFTNTKAQQAILYVGSNATLDGASSSDVDMVDSINSWGFEVQYIGQSEYDAAEGIYDGIDGIFFGESVDSKQVRRFGTNPEQLSSGKQDNFPVNWITLEGGAMLFDLSRWGVLAEFDGEILINSSGEPSEEDLQFEVINDSHYIMRPFQVGDVVTWSNATELALVPYFGEFSYEMEGLTKPVVEVKSSVTEMVFDEAYTMGVVTISEEIKGFFATMTHSLIEDQNGTPEFFGIIHRACDYIYSGAGVGTELNRTDDGAGFVAYPNPVSEELTIRILSESTDPALVTVCNLAGAEVKQLLKEKTLPGHNYIFLDVNDLTDGIYILKLDSEGVTSYRKVLVNK
ncbi:MAG: T9SS type A sorting domain-containing protein [Bacteroidales bacterium]|nr:T9SS type A sorting domain-containing protein [Bacteroidales bacterium]MBN2699228.1 T9SS type A sorting domain-containing protein [Bacteroidales bacterium]